MKKPNCLECGYRRSITWDAHSQCTHPLIGAALKYKIPDPGMIIPGTPATAAAGLFIKLNQHGVDSGWCRWPYNFDPIWIDACDGFTTKHQVCERCEFSLVCVSMSYITKLTYAHGKYFTHRKKSTFPGVTLPQCWRHHV